MSPALTTWKNRFYMVRTNELSCESLHGQAALMERHAGVHDAPFLSFGLRCGEVLERKFFTMSDWAAKAGECLTDFAT